MRRSNTQTIAEVIHEYIDALKIRRKLKESRIEKQWEELLGQKAASLTKKIYIKQGILYVHVNSSALSNEILMMRETLIKKINEKAGEELITKIVLR
jgi:predicted nucleic acid-binding Zn ribbon protein